ncbi:hypothetical protein [Streptomyces gobitricini]|uniref:hypothetical protein n=1 Tax=Streptomyces gobitricini TaxID=68211 RepID=UPI0031DFAB07
MSPARAKSGGWGRAAAAAGVVLLVAGCGGGSDKETGTPAPPSGATAPVGAGAEAEAGGGPDAAAVTEEISAAATAAGFTEEPSDEDVPPALKPCMVSWQVDDEKVTDSEKSYDDTVAALARSGWKESQKFDHKGSVITSLDKGGWTVKASHHGQGGFLTVSFVATDNGPECEKLFKEDLEKNKNAR